MNKKICLILLTLIFLNFPCYSIASEPTDIVIQAEDYMAGGEGIGYHDTTVGLDDEWAIDRGDDVEVMTGNGGIVVSFQSEEWLSYSIFAPVASEYSLKIVSSSVGYSPEHFNRLYVCVNSKKILNNNFELSNDWKLYKESQIGTIRLNAGENIIKIKNTGTGGISFDCFTLSNIRKISTAKEQEILLKLNSTFDIKGILKEFENETGLYSEEMTKGIWYKDGIYTELIGKGFTTLKQVQDEINKLVSEEKNNPKITLTKDGTYKNQLETGNLSFTIKRNDIFTNIISVLAIYKGNKLDSVGSCKISANSQGQIDIKNFIKDPNTEYTVKFLFWEEANEMKPYILENYKNVIYVAPYGNNSGTGKINSPYQSIAKAQSEVKKINKNMTSDIEVRIYPGDYSIKSGFKFLNTDSGTNNYNVIYKGSNPYEKPVINGGKKIENWQFENGLWKAQTASVVDVRQLYVDDKRAVRARSTRTYKGTANYDDPITAQSEDGFYVDGLPRISDPSNMEIVWNIDWTNQRLPVKTIITQNDKKAIVMKQPYYYWGRTKEYDRTNPDYSKAFYLENAKELIDEPGEFYYDKANGTIYYKAFNYEDPNEVDCYIGAVQNLMSVTGTESQKAQNLTFENLAFEYGTWFSPNEKGVLIIQSDKMVNKAGDSIGGGGEMMHSQIKIENAKNIAFRNNKVVHQGSAGVGLPVSAVDCEISGNEFTDLSAGSIIVGSWEHNEAWEESLMCKNITVSDNMIRDISREFYASPAISAYYVQNVSIIHNDIAKTPYTAISLGWGWGEDVFACRENKIIGNKVNEVVNILKDGSHIYTLGPMRNSIISNNYLVKNFDTRGGIYTDQGSAYITIENNVVEKCYYWVYIWTASISDLIVRNNFSDNERMFNKGTNITMENNTVVANGAWSGEALNIVNRSGVRSSQ